MLWLSALFSVVKIFEQSHAFVAVCVRKEKSLSGFFPWWFLDNWLLFVVAHALNLLINMRRAVAGCARWRKDTMTVAMKLGWE